jgi:RNA polymerase sigma-70 factor (ECF subfamily)
LVQEILFAVWRALPAFRGDGPLRGFVARIASHRAASHVASALRTPAMSGLENDHPATGDSPEGAAVAVDSQARLLRAVRELPLVSRQVVTLTLEGFAPAEIAAALGITANAVSIRLTRSKEQLRKRIGESE